jgi:hypothetical protein
MRLLILTLAAGLLFAQDKPAETKTEPSEASVIPVKTLTGDSFDRLLRMLSVFGVQVRGDSQLRTILVYAPKDVVDQMRHVVEQLDRPGSEAAIGRNIDMTLTFLRCSAGATAGAALSAEMEQVAKQLRAATSCKDVQVWDTLPLRLQEGKDASDDLRLPGVGPAGQHVIVRVQLHPEAVYRKEQARYVRFSRVKIDFKVPMATGPSQSGAGNALVNTQFTYVDLGMNTSGDFMEGQKTVIGKVSGMAEDESIYAVVAIKVLD